MFLYYYMQRKCIYYVVLVLCLDCVYPNLYLYRPIGYCIHVTLPGVCYLVQACMEDKKCKNKYTRHKQINAAYSGRLDNNKVGPYHADEYE